MRQHEYAANLKEGSREEQGAVCLVLGEIKDLGICQDRGDIVLGSRIVEAETGRHREV